jgi:hypothetical protein
MSAPTTKLVSQWQAQMHQLGEVLAGLLLHPRDRAVELIAFHRDFLKDSPDELFSGKFSRRSEPQMT